MAFAQIHVSICCFFVINTAVRVWTVLYTNVFDALLAENG